VRQFGEIDPMENQSYQTFYPHFANKLGCFLKDMFAFNLVETKNTLA